MNIDVARVKQCLKCKEFKLLQAFGVDRQKKDGLNCYCKECIKTREKQKRLANSEKLRAMDRARRAADPEKYRRKMRAWYASHPGYWKRFYQSHPGYDQNRRRVRAKVGNAVQSRKFPAATTQQCSMCGRQAAEYHHLDYSKPFDVVPLCVACHKKVHVRER